MVRMCLEMQINALTRLEATDSIRMVSIESARIWNRNKYLRIHVLWFRFKNLNRLIFARVTCPTIWFSNLLQDQPLKLAFCRLKSSNMVGVQVSMSFWCQVREGKSQGVVGDYFVPVTICFAAAYAANRV